MIALKQLESGWRSCYNPYLVYPTKPGTVVKVNKSRYHRDKKEGYGLHFFIGKWYEINVLPNIMWRRADPRKEHCLVVKLDDDYKVINKYKCQTNKEPYNFVDVFHVKTWKATVLFAGTYKQCQKFGKKYYETHI